MSESKTLVKTVANIITGNLLGQATKLNREVDTLISKENLIELARLFEDSKINNQGIAKAIDILVQNPSETLDKILADNNLLQITDTSALAGFVDQVVGENQDKVAEYQSGKVQLIGFFVGQCMKISGGTGNPKLFNELLTQKLK
jgi:aspartyl-tRNA(Asn)/glutamyl-tRNA(Gln) amidotransferase subunit B